jgi:riboflavin kinase / FMN adenylyltransferase
VRIVRGAINYPKGTPGPVVTIGNFDGLHLGHQALLSRAKEMALSQGVDSCLLTFDPYPREVLRPQAESRRLQSITDKLTTIEALGIDVVVLASFNTAFASRSAEWFANTILKEQLRASGVVIGWNFSFGQGRSGGPDDLRSLLDVPVVVTEPVEAEGAVVSSTRIRNLVEQGDVLQASKLLRRFHRFTSVVSKGDGRGRKLGYRTANLVVGKWFVPSDGVYAVRTQWEGQTGTGIANIGDRPTFDGEERRVEVHLFGDKAPKYGEFMSVDFVGRVRDQHRFTSTEALQSQIPLDIEHAQRLLGESPKW